ncbi:GGDEF domain-containing protein [Azohydromonas australica]|uniref:GGDEF domain-containing protein n=1 Tax=Azohydromonas australica TaxID=364039 RepID=UPI00041CEB09|nr:diguanylate cyclase [Azohydromonas australica]
MLHRIAWVLRLPQFLALLILIGMGVVLYGVLVDSEKAGRWVERTYRVIGDIESVRMESLRCESWLRDLMLNANKDALEQARSSAERATQAAGRLVILTADNDPQSRTVQAIQARLSEVQEQYLHAADVAEHHDLAVSQPLVAARVNSNSAHELHNLLNQAEAVERSLLQIRSFEHNERLDLLKKLLAGEALAFMAVMIWTIRYTEHLLRTNRVKSDAVRDPLTGLLNRRGLEHQLAALVCEPRGHDHCRAVVMFDLDDFRSINDRYSHAAGDQVLQKVGSRLRQQCWVGDVVARIGNDKFVVVLASIASHHEAVAMTQRVRNALMAPIPLGTAVVRIGVSVGIAMLHHDGHDVEALLSVADEKMYEAKEAGKRQASTSTHILEPVGG